MSDALSSLALMIVCLTHSLSYRNWKLVTSRVWHSFHHPSFILRGFWCSPRMLTRWPMRRLTRWSRRWARKKVAIFLRENGLRGFGSLVGGIHTWSLKNFLASFPSVTVVTWRGGLFVRSVGTCFFGDRSSSVHFFPSNKTQPLFNLSLFATIWIVSTRCWTSWIEASFWYPFKVLSMMFEPILAPNSRGGISLSPNWVDANTAKATQSNIFLVAENKKQ